MEQHCNASSSPPPPHAGLVPLSRHVDPAVDAALADHGYGMLPKPTNKEPAPSSSQSEHGVMLADIQRSGVAGLQTGSAGGGVAGNQTNTPMKQMVRVTLVNRVPRPAGTSIVLRPLLQNDDRAAEFLQKLEIENHPDDASDVGVPVAGESQGKHSPPGERDESTMNALQALLMLRSSNSATVEEKSAPKAKQRDTNHAKSSPSVLNWTDSIAMQNFWHSTSGKNLQVNAFNSGRSIFKCHRKGTKPRKYPSLPDVYLAARRSPSRGRPRGHSWITASRSTTAGAGRGRTKSVKVTQKEIEFSACVMDHEYSVLSRVLENKNRDKNSVESGESSVRRTSPRRKNPRGNTHILSTSNEDVVCAFPVRRVRKGGLKEHVTRAPLGLPAHGSDMEVGSISATSQSESLSNKALKAKCGETILSVTSLSKSPLSSPQRMTLRGGVAGDRAHILEKDSIIENISSELGLSSECGTLATGGCETATSGGCELMYEDVSDDDATIAHRAGLNDVRTVGHTAKSPSLAVGEDDANSNSQKKAIKDKTNVRDFKADLKGQKLKMAEMKGDKFKVGEKSKVVRLLKRNQRYRLLKLRRSRQTAGPRGTKKWEIGVAMFDDRTRSERARHLYRQREQLLADKQKFDDSVKLGENDDSDKCKDGEATALLASEPDYLTNPEGAVAEQRRTDWVVEKPLAVVSSRRTATQKDSLVCANKSSKKELLGGICDELSDGLRSTTVNVKTNDVILSETRSQDGALSNSIAGSLKSRSYAEVPKLTSPSSISPDRSEIPVRQSLSDDDIVAAYATASSPALASLTEHSDVVTNDGVTAGLDVHTSSTMKVLRTKRHPASRFSMGGTAEGGSTGRRGFLGVSPLEKSLMMIGNIGNMAKGRSRDSNRNHLKTGAYGEELLLDSPVGHAVKPSSDVPVYVHSSASPDALSACTSWKIEKNSSGGNRAVGASRAIANVCTAKSHEECRHRRVTLKAKSLLRARVDVPSKKSALFSSFCGARRLILNRRLLKVAVEDMSLWSDARWRHETGREDVRDEMMNYLSARVSGAGSEVTGGGAEFSNDDSSARIFGLIAEMTTKINAPATGTYLLNNAVKRSAKKTLRDASNTGASKESGSDGNTTKNRINTAMSKGKCGEVGRNLKRKRSSHVSSLTQAGLINTPGLSSAEDGQAYRGTDRGLIETPGFKLLPSAVGVTPANDKSLSLHKLADPTQAGKIGGFNSSGRQSGKTRTKQRDGAGKRAFTGMISPPSEQSLYVDGVVSGDGDESAKRADMDGSNKKRSSQFSTTGEAKYLKRRKMQPLRPHNQNLQSNELSSQDGPKSTRVAKQIAKAVSKKSCGRLFVSNPIKKKRASFGKAEAKLASVSVREVKSTSKRSAVMTSSTATAAKISRNRPLERKLNVLKNKKTRTSVEKKNMPSRRRPRSIAATPNRIASILKRDRVKSQKHNSITATSKQDQIRPITAPSLVAASSPYIPADAIAPGGSPLLPSLNRSVNLGVLTTVVKFPPSFGGSAIQSLAVSIVSKTVWPRGQSLAARECVLPLQYQCVFCACVSSELHHITEHMVEQHQELAFSVPPMLRAQFDGAGGSGGWGQPPLFMLCRHCDYVAVETLPLWIHFELYHGVQGVLSPPTREEEEGKWSGNADVEKQNPVRSSEADSLDPGGGAVSQTDGAQTVIGHMQIKRRSTAVSAVNKTARKLTEKNSVSSEKRTAVGDPAPRLHCITAASRGVALRSLDEPVYTRTAFVCSDCGQWAPDRAALVAHVPRAHAAFQTATNGFFVKLFELRCPARGASGGTGGPCGASGVTGGSLGASGGAVGPRQKEQVTYRALYEAAGTRCACFVCATCLFVVYDARLALTHHIRAHQRRRLTLCCARGGCAGGPGVVDDGSGLARHEGSVEHKVGFGGGARVCTATLVEPGGGLEPPDGERMIECEIPANRSGEAE